MVLAFQETSGRRLLEWFRFSCFWRGALPRAGAGKEEGEVRALPFSSFNEVLTRFSGKEPCLHTEV